MSKHKRSGRTFRTLGQRMLSFGRDIMRTYANDVPIQPDTPSAPSRPQGQWRSMSNNNLVWRQEQTPTQQAPAPNADTGYYNEEAYYEDYGDYDNNAPQPIQRRPQQAAPVQRRPQPPQQQPPQPQQQPGKPAPTYVQTNDGTPIKVSRKQFDSPLQQRLEAIMAAHEAVNEVRNQERDKKIENIQRKMESGELSSTRRRRGSIEVDYVKTDSLVPPDERDKIQAKQEESSATKSPESQPDVQAEDDSQWFDEVPDDDADLDNMAGFESSDDDIQRIPDDLPRFNPSDSEEGDSDDMGEFEGGYYNTPPTTTDHVINRSYEDYPAQDFSDSDTLSDAADTPIQRDMLPSFDADDDSMYDTVPIVPDIPMDATPPSNDAPLQRTANNDRVNDEGVSSSPERNIAPESRIQRESIQQTDTDTPDYPVADFDTSNQRDTFNDVMPSADVPSNNTPIQRDTFNDVMPSADVPSNNTPIQRDTLDTADDADMMPSADVPASDVPVQRDSYDDYDTPFGDTFENAPDIGAGQTPSVDAPIQRDTFDEPDYSDDDVMSYDTGNPIDSGRLPSSDMPIQRTPLDEPDDANYDNISYDADPPTNITANTPSTDTPVQRSIDSDMEIPSVDAPMHTPDYDEPDNNSFDMMPSADVPASDTPIQRTEINQPEYDDYAVDNYSDVGDYGDYSDAPTIETQANRETPVQRDYDDGMMDMMPSADVPDFDEFADTAPLDSLTVEPPKDNSPSPSSPIQRTPADQSPEPPVSNQRIQRQADDTGGDYEDYGDATWAEMNDYSSESFTSQDAPTGSDAPIQRSESDDIFAGMGDEFPTPSINAPARDTTSTSDNTPIQRVESDDIFAGMGDEFPTSPVDVPAHDAPIQRQAVDEPDFETPDTFTSFDTPAAPSNTTPIQRDMELDDADYGEQTWAEANNYSPASDGTPTTPDATIQRETNDDLFAGESLSIGHDTSDNAPVQRQPIQRDMDNDYDDFGELAPSNDVTADAPIQREIDDDLFAGESLSIGHDTTDNAPVQRQPIQRDMDNDYDDFGEQTWAQANDYSPASDATPTTGDAPIQRDIDNNYDDFGEQTWAQANDYSPASDATPTTGDTPIQREANYELPSFDDFDPMEDTDGMTAMNILGDYLAEQKQTPASGGDATPSIQRDYQEDNFEYLPEGFDPTPQFYDFGDANDSDMGQSDNIQRRADDDSFENSGVSQQPIDLFTALSRAGALKPATDSSTSQTDSSPIQRTTDDSGDESYEDYGDMTWAEMNDYSPATDQANGIQRTPDDSFDTMDESPPDLFSALARAGGQVHRDNPSPDSSIQRSNRPDKGGVDSEMVNLYNAMMESGMIQQSDGFASRDGSGSDTPIQRETDDTSYQHQPVDIGEALRQVNQVSESSGSNGHKQSSRPNTEHIAQGIARAIQRDDTDLGTGNISPSDTPTSAEIGTDDENNDVGKDDKSYLDQLARDVYRIIRRRLREEKERRG